MISRKRLELFYKIAQFAGSVWTTDFHMEEWVEALLNGKSPNNVSKNHLEVVLWYENRSCLFGESNNVTFKVHEDYTDIHIGTEEDSYRCTFVAYEEPILHTGDYDDLRKVLQMTELAECVGLPNQPLLDECQNLLLIFNERFRKIGIN